jgi:hypothetical protein
MPICKAIVTLTILAEADSPQQFAKELSEMELEEIDRATMDGDWIGTHSLDSIEVVPANNIRKELFKIGNDGTFFDPPDD